MLPVLPLALAFPIAPEPPDARNPCYDPCNYLNGAWTELEPYNAERIPSDGVLVLQGARLSLSTNLPSHDGVALTVTRDDQPIAGTLEATEASNILVWRPTEPWTPGATYRYELMVMNLQPWNPDIECAPAMLQHTGELVIDEAPAAGLTAPSLGTTVKEIPVPFITVQTLACCDGAEVVQDGYCGVDPVYDPDECAPTVARRQLAIEWRATPASTGPAAEQALYVLRSGNRDYRWQVGDPVFLDYLVIESKCAHVRIVDLATGNTVMSPTACIGEDLPNSSDEYPLDPRESLACEPSPLRCIEDDYGDQICTPSPEEETTSDTEDSDAETSHCGCTSIPDSDTGLILLLGLTGLPRRRSSR